MNAADFQDPSTGTVVQASGGEAAFVPAPLPPLIAYDADLVLAVSRAAAARASSVLAPGPRAPRAADARGARRPGHARRVPPVPELDRPVRQHTDDRALRAASTGPPDGVSRRVGDLPARALPPARSCAV